MTCQKCGELNYVFAMVNQVQNNESIYKMRQSEVNCWANIDEVRDECMKVLNVTINQIDGYLEDLKQGGHVEFHHTNRGVKRIGEAAHVPCTHGEIE